MEHSGHLDKARVAESVGTIFLLGRDVRWQTLELCGLPLERSVRRGVTTEAPHVEAGATEHAGPIEKTVCGASWHLAAAVHGEATRLTRRTKPAGTGRRSRDGCRE